MFSEVKRHKPSVVYIPHVDTWYATLGATALKVLTTMLMDIPPYEPVLLFGTADCEASELDRDILRALFPFSRKNRVEIARPNSVSCFPTSVPILSTTDCRIGQSHGVLLQYGDARQEVAF